MRPAVPCEEGARGNVGRCCRRSPRDAKLDVVLVTVAVALLGLGTIAASPLFPARPSIDIPYYLPADLSQLDIALETTEVGRVSRVLPEDPKKPVSWKFKRSVSLVRTGALALRTVADPSAKREFRIPRATLSDVKATVELTDSGLLAAINTSAAGRGDDLLLAVAKFAGVAAGFWTGAPVAGLAYASLTDQQHAMALMHAAPPASLCLPIDQLEIEGVAVEMQAFVSLEPAGCLAFLRFRAAADQLERKRIQREQFAELLPGAAGADLTDLNKKLQNARLEVAYAEAVQAERRATLAALYDKFATARCLGKTVGRETFHELLTLDRLPSARNLGWLAPTPDLSRDSMAQKLAAGGWNEMHALFARTGVVATLDDAPNAAITTPPQTDEKGRPVPAAAASEIAWRQAVPVRVRIWALAGARDSAEEVGEKADACAPQASETAEDPDAAAVAELSFDGVLDVLHPESPVRTLPVEARAFADRSLTIAFDPRGRPRKIDTSGSSSAAGFAQAAAASAQGFRDEYDATLKKRVSIEESKRELSLDGLNDEIAALEAQNRALDARAELLGTAGSFDDIVARQRLDSELKLLEAQVALRMAEATVEQRVAIAELEKRVLETQKRLALLETEQALEDARRK